METHRAQLPTNAEPYGRDPRAALVVSRWRWGRDVLSMIAPGVDVRATGGYVIARHCWLPVLQEAALAPWPAWLLPVQPMASRRGSEPPRAPDDRQLAALVRFVASAPVKHRNNRLFWAACRIAGMVVSRLLAKSEAEAAVVARGECTAGLSENEARKTVNSGLTTGRAGLMSGASPNNPAAFVAAALASKP